MTRVVLDTNVVVSALLSPAGFEDRVLKLSLGGRVQLYISAPVLAEYERVPASSKFGFNKRRIRSAVSRLRAASHTVNPVRRLSACRHDDDNRFLECADAASADFLITGNQRHFPARWKQTRLEQTVSIRS
jgi:putative PIN family toxin of toxin-antitoxin system